MIARISSKGEQGFYALHRTANGDWVPLSDSPETSADQAVRRCADDVCDSLERLKGDISRRMELAHDNMARLMDHPATSDSVVIAGARCIVEPGGVIAGVAPGVFDGVPSGAITGVAPGVAPGGAGRAPETATRGTTGTKARGPELSEELYEVLSRALDIDIAGEAEPGRLLADCALNTPLDVLAIVAQAKPSLLGEAAAFLVQVHTSGSQQSAAAPAAATPGPKKPTEKPGDKPTDKPAKKPGGGPR